MNEKEMLELIKGSENGKMLVADLMSKGDIDEITGLIDALSLRNQIRVLKDKDLKRLVVRLTGKVEFDLSEKPAATDAQVSAFKAASFTFENAFVTNFGNHRRYSFRVVKLAGKSFADVFTPDGKQAGFIKYITSTVHPWFDEVDAKHRVLQFTTIAEGKNILDRESGLSYWINKDFYTTSFSEIHKKDGFQMKSMAGLVKLVINKMYPKEEGSNGETVRRPSLRIRINSDRLSAYNSKEIDRDIEIGGKALKLTKASATEEEDYPTLFLMDGDTVVAEAYFRGYRNSNNFFESQVVVKNAKDLIPSEIIGTVSKIMDEESTIQLGNAFKNL